MRRMKSLILVEKMNLQRLTHTDMIIRLEWLMMGALTDFLLMVKSHSESHLFIRVCSY